MLARQPCDAPGDTARSAVPTDGHSGAGPPPSAGLGCTGEGDTHTQSCSRRCISPSAIPSVYTAFKEKQDQMPLRQLPQLLSRAPPVSEGFTQPGAIEVVPALPRGHAWRKRRKSRSPSPAPRDRLRQLFPIDPGTALQEKNREQKVGENPSFQGKEGNDQENRKASLVPNTRHPDLTNLLAARHSRTASPPRPVPD